MMPFGLNHMTVPRCSARDLVVLAQRLGLVGIELRNDLQGPLFDGMSASDFGAFAREAGQRLLTLAEVKAFNRDTTDRMDDALALMASARDVGAEGVALIPAVAQSAVARGDQRDALATALTALRPALEDHGLVGLIEPLGFANSSLRFKSDVLAVLDDLGRPDCFAIIHDTFHHALAGEDVVAAEATRLVHVSGVTSVMATAQMTDADRVLVGPDDRLGNIAQLRALDAAGFAGPISTEAFAPSVHQISDPAAALAASQEFITSQLVKDAA